MTHAIYLTDMSKCLPEDALSTTPTRHKWQVVDYDAGDIVGHMVCAPPPYDTPEITLPLNVTGWHALSVGFWPGIEQEHAHALGLEFHTYYRMSIVDEAHPYFFLSTETAFLREHPQCRIVARDGTPLIKASYAFPEARAFMVSLIEEAMAYDIDGVNLCFIRGPEYVGYEQPVVDDFKRLYGEDAREVADDDERLLSLKAGYLTELVRAVRQVADQHGAQRGRRMQVSATFEGGKENMAYLGYDAYTWVRERLVDFIITSPPSDLVRLAQENHCQVYMGPPLAWSGDDPLESIVLATRHALAGDMDGVAIWDANTTNPEMWSVCSRLGHRDELMDLREPSRYPKMKRRKLLSIRGRDFAHTLNKDVPSHFYGPHPGGLPEMLAIYTGG